MNFQVYDTKYGKFLLNSDDNISGCLIDGYFWESELLPYFDCLTKNDTVVEVGSYIGDHTVYLSKKCKIVYAYEAFQRNYYQLIANLFLNDCYNVFPFNMAIGNYEIIRPAEVEDGFEVDYENNASGARFVDGKESDNPIGLATPLDSLDIDNVTLLKIDAEGMDLSIMLGAIKLIKRYKPRIIFEYNELISPPLKDHVELLSSLGYTCNRLSKYNFVADYVG
jgi:FkbM family methyltransferase